MTFPDRLNPDYDQADYARLIEPVFDRAAAFVPDDRQSMVALRTGNELLVRNLVYGVGLPGSDQWLPNSWTDLPSIHRDAGERGFARRPLPRRILSCSPCVDAWAYVETDSAVSARWALSG